MWKIGTHENPPSVGNSENRGFCGCRECRGCHPLGVGQVAVFALPTSQSVKGYIILLLLLGIGFSFAEGSYRV